MSTNRIRYAKNPDKSWTSVQTYQAGDLALKAHMSPSMKEGAISNATTGEFILTVTSKSPHSTKKMLKAEMLKLGVPFTTEKREKTSGQEVTETPA